MVPFALTDAMKPQNKMMHNFIMYLGITKTKLDKAGRFLAILVISCLENNLQIVVVILEMIKLRKTINFVQAGNPIYAVAMIYKVVGPIIGQILA